MEYVQLFSKGRLNDLAGSLAGFLGKASQATAQRLQSWDADDLLNTPVDDVVEQLVRWVRSNAPICASTTLSCCQPPRSTSSTGIGANSAPDA